MSIRRATIRPPALRGGLEAFPGVLTHTDSPVPSEAAPHAWGELLCDLAEALHRSGAPVARLESALERVAERLDLPLEILATPTSLLMAFGRGRDQQVRLLRVEPGEVHLARLAGLDGLLRDIEGSGVGPRLTNVAMGRERLEQLEIEPAPFGPNAELCAAALASGTAAFFFGGGAWDALAAALLGLNVAALPRWFAGAERWQRLHEPLSATLVAFAATALARLGLPVEAGALTLAGLIALVPGYSLTISLTDLANRHLVAGVARLAGVLGTLLGMALGVGLGRAMGELVPAATAPAISVPAGTWGLVLAALCTPLCFTVLFRARARDAWAIEAAGVAAFGAGMLGAQWLGGELGGLFGAAALAVAANGLSRKLKLPSSIFAVPGLMLLVPGSLGLRSMDAFLAEDALSGIEAAFSMVLSGSALAGGLLVGNVLLPPRRSL